MIQVGSVFIAKDDRMMIVVTEVLRDDNVVFFRYLMTYSNHRVGAIDWAFVHVLTNDSLWDRIA